MASALSALELDIPSSGKGRDQSSEAGGAPHVVEWVPAARVREARGKEKQQRMTGKERKFLSEVRTKCGEDTHQAVGKLQA